MKFLGSFILLAILNIVSVFAGPQPPIYTSDGVFEYYINSDIAHIIRVHNLYAKELVVTPYAYYNGKRYNVHDISSGLTGSRVEKITIHESIQHEFSLGGSIFNEAKYLKTIQVDAPNVYFYDPKYNGIKRNVVLQGKGVEKMALRFAKNFLKEEYNINTRSYSYSTSDYQRMQHLYELGRDIKPDFSYNTNVSNADSGIHTLIYKSGSTLGIARAFRILALAMGFGVNDVCVAGDNRYFSWNIINLHHTWVHYDIVHTKFRTGQGDVSVFYNDDDFISRVLTPAYGSSNGINKNNFVVYLANYGYPGEVSGSTTKNYLQWLADYRKNIRSN